MRQTRKEDWLLFFALLFAFVVALISLPGRAEAQTQVDLGDMAVDADWVPIVDPLLYLIDIAEGDYQAWTEVVLDADTQCSKSAIQTAITNDRNTNPQLPTVMRFDAGTLPCVLDMTDTGAIIIPNDSSGGTPVHDFIFDHKNSAGTTTLTILAGQGDEATTKAMRDGDGYNEEIWWVGDSNDRDRTAYVNWTGGYAQGTHVLQLDALPTGAADGVIVEIESADWPERHGSSIERSREEITCVHNGSAVGSDCTGVTTLNQIRIKWPLLDNWKPTDISAAVTGHQVRVLTNVPRRLGVLNADFDTQLENRGQFDKVEKAITLKYCYECIVAFADIEPGWTRTIGSDDSGRSLFWKNILRGPQSAQNCTTDVVLVENENPLSVVIEEDNDSPSGIDCTADWTNNQDRITWFSGTDMANLNNKFFEREQNNPANQTVNPDGTGGALPAGQLRITLEDIDGSTGTGDYPIVGDGAGGLAANHNNWNRAGFQLSNGGSHTRVSGNACENMQVCVLMEGQYGHYIDHNYAVRTDPLTQIQRHIFDHGKGNRAGVIENNHVTVMEIEENTGPVSGPDLTWFGNRIDGSVDVTPLVDDTTYEGRFTCEHHNDDPAIVERITIFNNHFRGASCFAGNANIDEDNGSPPGPKRNHYSGYNIGWESVIALENPTESGSFNVENYFRDDAPAGWSAFNMPPSVAIDTAPAGWCDESGTWPNIGAFYDDYNGGTPNYSKLPAQIMLEGGVCTTGAAPTTATIMGTGFSINVH